MHLHTLYYLLLGTLILSTGVAAWESRSNACRRSELRLLALAYATLTAGCTLLATRAALPLFLGYGLSHVIVVTGYALVALGVARLAGVVVPSLAFWALPLYGALWMRFGANGSEILFATVAGTAVVVPNLAAAVILHRRRAAIDVRSRPLAVAVFGAHAAFYALRALHYASPETTPFLAAATAPEVTMFGGVIYSVAMPFSLLMLTREETAERLFTASQKDWLTGLDNRRAFMEKAALLAAPLAAARRRLILLLADLDHFKSINDRFGHQAGDEVLRVFARVAEAEADPSIVVARLGGEEFVVLMKDRDMAEAEAFSVRLMQRFREATRPILGPGTEATASIGLAILGQGEGVDKLLSRADAALYAAKAGGRDCFRWAQTLPAGTEAKAPLCAA